MAHSLRVCCAAANEVAAVDWMEVRSSVGDGGEAELCSPGVPPTRGNAARTRRPCQRVTR